MRPSRANGAHEVPVGRVRHVLFVSPAPGRAGGVSQMLANLIGALRNRDPQLAVRIVDPGGVSGVSAIVRYAGALGVSALWMARHRHGSIVHVNMASRGSTVRKLPFVLLGRLLRIPVLVHLHGGAFPEFIRSRSRIARSIIGAALRRAASMVVLGEVFRTCLVNDLSVPRQRVSVLHNATPALPISGSKPDQSDVCKLLFLGRLGEQKGATTLVEALRLVAERNPEAAWTATVAGDGHVQALREMADEFGLDDRVSVPGWVDRSTTASMLEEADVFVLPSRAEGLPTAMLEAMSVRAAVVTTPVGAIPEVIEDGVNGLLVPVADVERLAQAVQTVIDDSTLRRKLAEAGYQTWASRHRLDDYAETFLGLYASAVHDQFRAGAKNA